MKKTKIEKPISPYEITWHTLELKKWVKKIGLKSAIESVKKHVEDSIKTIIKG